ncbi:uncharacterized protein METZ01_LOCUS415758 [marine metagenome]|uniref:Uncharacterized protein n=1 Tax=marine metagenome TaxID=408172 RepID=A0A382WW82_9ZZZZ
MGNNLKNISEEAFEETRIEKVP